MSHFWMAPLRIFRLVIVSFRILPAVIAPALILSGQTAPFCNYSVPTLSGGSCETA
jgi:hypothetical protein